MKDLKISVCLFAFLSSACAAGGTGSEHDTGVGTHTDAGPSVRFDAGMDASRMSVDAGAPASDAEMDSGPNDGGTDAKIDSGPDDAGSDAGYDAGTDAGIDAGFDAGTDAGYDAGHDAGVDAWVPPTIGCADGTVEQLYPGHTDIVGCNGSVNQCSAAPLCGTGWHLCTFSEYAVRGGATTSTTTRRWLASCIAHEAPSGCPAGYPRPTDSVCPSCAWYGPPAVLAIVGFYCGGAMFAGNGCHTGLAAGETLAAWGQDGSAPCTWGYAGFAGETAGATCCW